MCDKFGGLYTWIELMQDDKYNAGQGICPNGWHIPTQEEWNDLIIFIDQALLSDEKELSKQNKSKCGVNSGFNS